MWLIWCMTRAVAPEGLQQAVDAAVQAVPGGAGAAPDAGQDVAHLVHDAQFALPYGCLDLVSQGACSCACRLLVCAAAWHRIAADPHSSHAGLLYVSLCTQLGCSDTHLCTEGARALHCTCMHAHQTAQETASVQTRVCGNARRRGGCALQCRLLGNVQVTS